MALKFVSIGILLAWIEMLPASVNLMACRRRVHLAERLEQALDPVLRNPDAGVLHRDLKLHPALVNGPEIHQGRDPPGVDRDAPGERELDGVVDEVDDDLPQAGDVA